MNRYWLLAALCLGIWQASAQRLTIKNQETQRGIEGVLLTSEKFSAISNPYGQVEIEPFEGSEAIEIRSLGYKTLVLSFARLIGADSILYLEPTNLNLDEVVVSATRWYQNSSNLPSKISIVSSKEVALQNPQTAADLLGISGKVFVQKSQQGGGSPMIRGFATNRLLYTVDGIRMNNAIFRSGNIQNVINQDPLAIENTEILFGQGSVSYGSDAIGGVMSFQTLTPQFAIGDHTMISGKAFSRFASANQEKTGHFDLNLGWKKWAFVGSFSYWDFDHLRQGSQGPRDYVKPYHVQRSNGQDVVVEQSDPLLQMPSAYSQFNTMQKLRFAPNDNWTMQYAFHYSETSSYGRYDRHNRMRNGLPRYGQWDYGPQKWRMNHLEVNHHASKGLYDEMTLRLALQNFEESRIDRSFNATNQTTNSEWVDAYSANWDFSKALGAKHTLFYGLEYVLNDVNSEGQQRDIVTGSKTAGPSRYPDAQWSSIAAYAQEEYRMTDQLTVQGGLRYNVFLLDADFSDNSTFYPFPFDEAEIKDAALTGNVGLVYRPSASWVIKSNWGTAFRAPNVDDMGKVFDSEPGAVVVPNPDLQAEYAYNVDLGVAKVFNDRVKVDLTGYYTILNHAMVRRDYVLEGQDSLMYDGVLSQVQAIQNAAKAHVYGLQAGLDVKLPVGFGFASHLNYQVGKEEMDDGTKSPSRHAAPVFGVSRLTYELSKLNLELNAQYQGEVTHADLSVSEQGKTEIYALDAAGNTYAPSWYTLNLKAMYAMNELLTLNAGVENLTDQRYRPYSSGISGAGRNFILSVMATF
ncbi:TonB-dependent receptor plug domain-containing protein [Reichenbachiella ulvae]|uniref:TonB-dependent receptor n=1 Tax=Reichenbachiella ulvae TaxID=2980104 RepID=A0ABT3CNG6_9BACT|nr:TonB-dependent receptor [Reichenbachiella ulvae]MCV9385132.1 TonB-dependent receptor [Reichenbachiella ulvae]